MKKRILIFLIISFIFIAFALYLSNDLNKNKLENFTEVSIEIEENEYNKATVNDAESFIRALEDENIKIIEIQSDMDMGYNLIIANGINSGCIAEHNTPLTHPILKQTGVSKLKIKNRDGLIIYSKSGSRILHTNFMIENSKNIKIENIKFEELWEWDEDTEAYYRRNDWDYITIKNSENIDIKNCEFSKSYDGITDINNCKNITIEYCKLNEIDIKKDDFFNAQFEELENNIEQYPMYRYLRKEVGLDINKIKELSAYQFKLYTIGTKDNCEKNENIVIHDNIFLNFKTRMPLARNSSIYLRNIYADQSKINYDLISKNELKLIKKKYPKIVSLSSHGVIAIQRSYVVVENIVLNGTKHKYRSYRGLSLFNLGKIVFKSKVKNSDNLKDMLQDEVGTKIYQ